MDKTVLQQKIQDLSRPIGDVLKAYTDAAHTTFSDEIGMKHPTQDVGMHIREDGSLELFAGEARILLDSETGSIVIVGNSLVTSTADVNVNVSDTNALAVNNAPINSDWTDYSLIDIDTSSMEPVTFRNAESSSRSYLTGTPATGQWLVPFDSVFDSKPLFVDPYYTEFLSALTDLVNGV